LLGACTACPAQVTTTAPVKFKQPKVKIDRFKGTVVNCTSVAITVRSATDTNTIRTFSFAPQLLRKMENRRMEKEAKVQVKYEHRSDTAVALKGKILK
jgi:hypothetical protein